MRRGFTFYVLTAAALGLAVGAAVNLTLPASQVETVVGALSLATDLFLRLIKMIIAPLVFATLVSGIAHMGEASSIGRVGGKTMIWFLGGSFVSLTVGMVMATLLNLGGDLALGAAAGAPLPAAGGLSAKEFLAHLVPVSVIDAMARNEILQLVVFSVFAGLAMASLGERAGGLVSLVEQLASVMLRITDYVMMFAPLGVFAALAATVADNGLGIIRTYATFVGGFYLSLGLLWVLLFAAGYVVLRGRLWDLARAVRAPALLAFSTASSEAAYPGTLEALERSGVAKKIASFVLPVGYSFNLDGSMVYTTFATMFIVHAYGVELTFGQQALMVGLLMVTSKGIAGVPRAALVVIAGALAFFDIPAAGLLLILGVDHFLDMGRSCTNVIGNSIAAAVVAKWEGQLLPLPADDRSETV